MLRFAVVRLLVALIPFVAWFAWAYIAKKRGKPMGYTPWAWLVAAGLALSTLTLLGAGVISPDNTDAVYKAVESQDLR